MRFSNLRVIWKIIVPALLLAIVLFVIVLQGYTALANVRARAMVVFDEHARKVLLAYDAYIHYDNVTTTDRDQVFAGSESTRAAAEKSYDEDIAAGHKALDELSAILADKAGHASLDTAKARLELFERLEHQAFQLARAGHRDQAYAIIMGDAATAYNDGTGILDSIVKGAVSGMLDQRQAINETVELSLRQTLLVSIVGCLVGFCALGWVAVYHISRPVNRSTKGLEILAAGNLAVEIEGTDRKDEIGSMARAFGQLREGLRYARELEAKQHAEDETKARRVEKVAALVKGFEDIIKGVVDSLTSSATALQTSAASMSIASQETQQQSSTVASASERASANVQAVAGATEQLTASSNEIGAQVEKASRMAINAVHETSRTSAVVDSLAQAAGKIEAVADLIQKIAGQTNLLALNATIEAVRAGDAGKGFAVVANEVKALASQTAKATADIGSEIVNVQHVTLSTIAAIKEIGGAITEISSVSSAIAAAVQEQITATGEISSNIQHAAQGATTISRNISSVAEAAEQTGTAAALVLTQASNLSGYAGTLLRQVNTFIAELNAA